MILHMIFRFGRSSVNRARIAEVRTGGEAVGSAVPE
jgi:hypothetical protein